LQRDTNIQFKQINTIDTYAVRHPVLRSGLARDSCAFDRDEDSGTIHLGAFFNQKHVGVLTLLPNPLDVQLRGMAVLKSHQCVGIGKMMMAKAEQVVRQLDKKMVWMNARLIAIPFYKKCGYKTTGNKFGLPYGGEHFKMTKILCD
jgi:GNAT superfamily N-acetyltransferase